MIPQCGGAPRLEQECEEKHMDRIGIELYDGVVDGQMLANIQRAARSIYGLRVLHVNSVFQGGGVAGMLNSLIPLMNDVGVNANWNLLYGDPDVFEITKKLHNGILIKMSNFNSMCV